MEVKMRKTNRAALRDKGATAALLGVSPATVLRWVRIGILPCVRLTDRTMRFRRSDLDAFISARSSGAGDAA
jgi:excisionase family DNA binding protein